MISRRINSNSNSNNNNGFINYFPPTPMEDNCPAGQETRGCCCKNRNRKSSIEWWDPPQESLPVAFTRDTSLHGLKYLGQTERHMFERIFWALAFIGSIVAAVMLINDLWNLYTTKPIIVSFQETETKMSAIPFPAVTICNVNNLKNNSTKEFRKAAEAIDIGSIDNETWVNMSYLDFVCSTSASFSQKLDFENALWPNVSRKNRERYKYIQGANVIQFLQANAQQCSAMIRKCLWEGIEKPCTDLFVPIMTDFGKCCTFNMVPESMLHIHKETRGGFTNKSFEEKWLNSSDHLAMEDLLLKPGEVGYDKPKRAKRPGKSYGLSILLDPDLDDYLCTTADSSGFQMVTHLPTEIPRVVDYGMAIKPDSEIFVRVIPEIITSDEEIETIDLTKRNCYFKDEFQLGFYKYYTAANCMDECFANWTYDGFKDNDSESCNCARYYMPRDKSRPQCTISQFNCTTRARNSFINNQNNKTNVCSMCLPACTEINYLTESSVSPIRKDIRSWIYPKTGDQAKWANRNVSIVHIYFGQDSTYSKIRRRLYGTTDMIAYAGGFLGLCMGFSGLSLLEIVYFLTVRAFYQFYYRKRHEQQGPRKDGTRSIWGGSGNGNQINGNIQSNFVIQTVQPKIPVSKSNGNGTTQFKKGDPNYFFGEIAPHYERQEKPCCRCFSH